MTSSRVSPTMMPISLDAGGGHGLEPVEQDRLVGHRHELLGAGVGDRPQARAGATGEDEALHPQRVLLIRPAAPGAQRHGVARASAAGSAGSGADALEVVDDRLGLGVVARCSTGLVARRLSLWAGIVQVLHAAAARACGGGWPGPAGRAGRRSVTLSTAALMSSLSDGRVATTPTPAAFLKARCRNSCWRLMRPRSARRVLPPLAVDVRLEVAGPGERRGPACRRASTQPGVVDLEAGVACRGTATSNQIDTPPMASTRRLKPSKSTST